MERTHLTSGPLFEENKFLKTKIKELTVREINLQNRLENLEYEVQLRKKNQSGLHLQHKLVERDDKKVEELADRVRELERKNKELSVLYKDLDSNLNTSVSIIRGRNGGSSLNSDISDFEINALNKSENISQQSQISRVRTESVIETNSDLPSALYREDDLLKENKELRSILIDKTKKDISMYEKIRGIEDDLSRLDKQQQLVLKKKKDPGSKEIEQNLKDISQFNQKKFGELTNKYADLSLRNREFERSIQRMNSDITSIISKQDRSVNMDNLDDLDSNLSNY
jgi:hypothetical protein